MHIDQMALVSAILRELGRQVPDVELQARQFNAIIKAADNIIAELKREEILAAPGIGIEAWRKTDQVGASSDFMAATLGNAGVRRYAYPHDPSDFGRCLTLLAAAPELRERLPQTAETGSEWAALVAHWDELEAMYREEEPTGKAPRLYERMKELLAAGTAGRAA